MGKIGIVLLEPEIPQNTGNIARTCAATGAKLHIVKPMGFAIDDKKLKRAGLDYWHLLGVEYYENLDDFFEKTKGGRYFYSTTKVKKRNEFSSKSSPRSFWGNNIFQDRGRFSVLTKAEAIRHRTVPCPAELYMCVNVLTLISLTYLWRNVSMLKTIMIRYKQPQKTDLTSRR